MRAIPQRTINKTRIGPDQSINQGNMRTRRAPLPDSAAMAVVVGRLRASRRHRAAVMGGGKASSGWHGSDGVEEEEGRAQRATRTGGIALGLGLPRPGVWGVGCGRVGVGSRRRRGLCCSVRVCDTGVVWFGSASAVVYVAGPGAPGHLPVCIAYGRLSLSLRIIIFLFWCKCLSGSHACFDYR